jgi:dTDP-4-amino-4,6-dideoxygalactose transaminase
MKSGYLGTGVKVAQFEAMFSDYKATRHAVAVN